MSRPNTRTIVGRFAPSPTGVLHLGNLRTALASWLSARAAGGRWIVRMEDVDRLRCRREWGEQQLLDLAALGLMGDGAVVWQSERDHRYRDGLERLREQGLLYSCRCSRKDLETLGSAPHVSEDHRPYPGRCRRSGFLGWDTALRFCLPEGTVRWGDRCLGAQEDDPSRITGDPVLFRRDGLVAYHLAVVVDDGDQGVTEIVRGGDLRELTATQIRLQECLGIPRPSYAHLGLVLASDGSRLGKRQGALGLEALQERGMAIPELLGWLGWSLGCLDRVEACSAQDLVAFFRWDRVPRTPIHVPAEWM